MAWLALRNAERNGDWARAGELAHGTIPRLERELERAHGTIPRLERELERTALHVVEEFEVEIPERVRKKLPMGPFKT